MNDTWLKMPPELRAELVLPGSRYVWKDEDEGYYLSVLDDAYMSDVERVEVARVEHTYDEEGTLLVVWFGFNDSVEKEPLKYSTKNVDEACRLIYALFMTGT